MVDFPGYSLSSQFRLEIPLGGRDGTEKIIMALDSFPLPELSAPGFEVIWGPRTPAIKYPGRAVYNDISIEITNFYEKEVVEFFVDWHTNCLEDYTAHVKDCTLLGFDDSGDEVFNARLKGVWPNMIMEGTVDRSVNRQRLTITFSIREIEHVFEG